MYARLLTFLMLLTFLSCGKQGTKTVSLDSKSAISYYYAAVAELEEGNFEQALAKLDTAILLKPTVATFHQVKGWVYTQLQRPDSAIVSYERALRYKSHFPEAWLNIGKLYLQVGDYENAAFYLKKATNEFPDSTRIHLLLGEAYYKAGRYLLARDHLRTYSRLASDTIDTYWKWLGFTYYKIHEFREAEKALQKYLTLHPQDPEALKMMGVTKFALEELDQAISYLNKAGKTLTTDPEIYIYRAKYFERYQKHNVALEQLHIGLQNIPNHPELLFEIAVLHYEHNELASARQTLQRLVESYPDFWRAYRYLGLVAESENQLQDAYRYYKLYLDNILEYDKEIVDRVKELQAKLSNQ